MMILVSQDYFIFCFVNIKIKSCFLFFLIFYLSVIKTKLRSFIPFDKTKEFQEFYKENNNSTSEDVLKKFETVFQNIYEDKVKKFKNLQLDECDCLEEFFEIKYKQVSTQKIKLLIKFINLLIFF